MLKINLDPKPKRCKHCGKPRGQHKARTLECPNGKKMGFMIEPFVADVRFEPKESGRKDA